MRVVLGGQNCFGKNKDCRFSDRTDCGVGSVKCVVCSESDIFLRSRFKLIFFFIIIASFKNNRFKPVLIRNFIRLV